MTDILSRIDDTLTYHSAGLGVDLEVPVERDDDGGPTLAEWFAQQLEERFGVPCNVNLVVDTSPITVRLDNSTATFTPNRPTVWEAQRFRVLKLFGVPLGLVDPVRRVRLRRMHRLYRQRRRTW